jgi:hypothetical protein
MRRIKWLMLAAIVAAASACASAAGRAAAEKRPATTVEVDNQALADMNVYVLRGSQRIRLGLATGLSRSRFTIPRGIVFGATSLRFLADPVGGNATPVSEEITVTEGEEVVLRIPPGAG